MGLLNAWKERRTVSQDAVTKRRDVAAINAMWSYNCSGTDAHGITIQLDVDAREAQTPNHRRCRYQRLQQRVV